MNVVFSNEKFAWWANDSKGGVYVLQDPNQLLYAENGDIDALKLIHTFPELGCDFIRLFIDSRDHIFVGIARSIKGTFRSTDGGKTFLKVIDAQIWGICEDKDGFLFSGNYESKHKFGNHAGVRVYFSADEGLNWHNIGLMRWAKQDHVHDVVVSPDGAHIYVTLGDRKKDMRDCWVLKNIKKKIISGKAGDDFIVVEGKAIELFGRVKIVGHNHSELNTIHFVDENIAYLRTPLSQDIDEGDYIFDHNWRRHIRHPGNGLFVKVRFSGGKVFLGDDCNGVLNPESTCVFVCDETYDSALPIVAQPSLRYHSNAFGAFNLEIDAAGRPWIAVRPVFGEGALWAWDDGKWNCMLTAPEEEVKREWRETNTFRDISFAYVLDKSTGRSVQALLTRYKGGACVIYVDAEPGKLDPVPLSQYIETHDDTRTNGNAVGSSGTTVKGKPLALVMGAERSGTSWLYSYIDSHPQIFISGTKQFHYFDADVYQPEAQRKRNQLIDFIKKDKKDTRTFTALLYRELMNIDEKYYIEYFNSQMGDELCFAEATPTYWKLDEARMRKATELHDDVRAIFIMRDPLTRGISYIKHALNRMGDIADEKAINIFKMSTSMPENSFVQAIQRMENVFGKDAVHVVFYENLFSSDGIKSICDFLGVPFVEASYDQPINAGAEYTLPKQIDFNALHDLKAEYERCFQMFGGIDNFPAQWSLSYKLLSMVR